MAIHISNGRNPSILLLALLLLAIAAGTASYMSRPDPETAQVSQIAANAPVVTPLAETMSAELPQIGVAEVEIALAPEDEVALAPEVEIALAPEVEVALAPEVEDEIALEVEVALAPEVEDEIALDVDAEEEAALEPDFEAVIVVAVEPAVAPVAAPVAGPVATPVVPSTAAQAAAPAAAPVAPRKWVTVARLEVAPPVVPAPRELAVSILRPKNMAPIPKRAPRAATADKNAAPQNAATLFQSGAAIRVQKDASVFITARNIPDNDRLLEAYSAERTNSGRVETRLGEATALPGLLGIAAQAQRTQSGAPGAPAYSLADAMRDAIWRKNTAARLKSLTTAQNACAEGVGDLAKSAPSIGLAAGC